MRIRVIIVLLAVVGIGMFTANMLVAQSVQYTDTSIMLSKYLRKSDTAQMVVPYLRKIDTANLVNRYLRKTDTASMLLPYLRRGNSGTLNFVPKLTSSNTIVNSQLFDNGTNVGIGTASPAAKLEVIGNAKFSGSLTTLGDIFITGTAKALVFNSAVNFNTQIYELSNSLIFRTGGTDRIRVDASGNVGIGAASPVTDLQISKAGSSTIRLTNTSNSTNVELGITTALGFVGTQTDNSFAINTNNTERIRITNSGNVGIGTTSPSEKFSLYGGDAVFTQWTGTGNGSFLKILNSTTTANGTTLQSSYFGSGGFGPLKFDVGGGVRMSITSSGNALIGTTTDNGVDKLQVSGSGSFITDVSARQYNATSGFGYNVGGFQFGGIASNRAFIYNSVTSRDALSINSTTDAATFSGSVTANGFIKSGGTASQYLMADGSISTLPNFMGGSGTLNYIPKLTGSNSIGNSQIFDNGTNVGIGIASPADKLNVNGNIRITQGYAQVRSTTDASLYLNNEVAQWKINNNSSNNFIINDALSDKFTILYNSGNVGIGTTSPASLLSLAGSTSTTNGLSITPAGWNNARHRFTVPISGDESMISFNYNGSAKDNAGYEYSHIYVGNGVLKFGTNGIEAIRVSSGARTLIGTNTDNGVDKLQVNGSASVSTNLSFGGQLVGTSDNTEQLIIKRATNSNQQFILGRLASHSYLTSITQGTGYNPISLNPSGGNILIGTATDNGVDKLQVNGSILSGNAGLKVGSSATSIASDGSSLYLKAAGNTYLNTASNAFVTNSGGASFGGTVGITGYSGIPITAGSSLFISGGFASPDAGRILFGDGTGWRMHLSSRLNSVTTDLFTFQDNGNVNIAGSATANRFIKPGGTASQYLMADGSISTLPNFMGGSGTLNYIPKLTGTNSIGNSQIFDNGTNVGIGTTNTLANLHVVANSGDVLRLHKTTGGGNGQLIMSTDFGGGNTYAISPFISGVSNGGFSIKDITNNINRIVIAGTTGNTLINTTTDNGVDKLQVNGSATITATDNTGNRTNPLNVLTITADNLNYPYNYFGGSILFKNRSYLNGIVNSSRIRSVIYDNGNNLGGGLWFETTQTAGSSLTPSMVINNSGNVGIGTTSPGQKLEVFGNALINSNTNTELKINSNGGAASLSLSNGAGSQSIYGGIGGSNNMDFYTNSIFRMRIDPSGNVGIGTASPGNFYKLDVLGNSKTSGYFSFNDKGYIRGGTSTNTLDLQSGTAGIYFMNSSYSVLNAALLDNGNFGIGTASPGQKLEVFGNTLINSNTNTELKINSNGGAASLVLSNGAGSQLIYGGVGGSNNMDFYTNSIFRMRIDPSGNVGIGTTTPGSYKLAVEGTIGARKMKITQQGIPWADYVFQDDYQLRSLESLDKYIQQYKHLPEVPTTKEVNENGLDVADTQALLLKKIEELTLYMIELKKENSNIKKELEMVKKSINKK